MKETLEEEDAEYSLLVFEYDNRGNEIAQIHDNVIYTLENVEYDDENNWLKQNVYLVTDNNQPRLISIFTRSIEYE
jgi:hypothetical protein